MARGRSVSRAFAALACATCLLSLSPRAGAWNAHGHMLIALIAYDALPADKRASLVRLLESHPRFRDDLLAAVPPSLRGEAERARWLFAYASTWPDIAGPQRDYGHGTWHYVNLPLELRQGELVTCKTARANFPESVRRVAEIDAARRARGEPGIPSGDSIVAALPKNLDTLADPTAPSEARALALSWVLHLVGDAHQPLHGVALFSRKRFPAGDRGGNDIAVVASGAAQPEPRSLHRVWDELLGQDTSLAALDGALGGLRAERWRWSAERAPATRLGIDTWIDEDCDLARSAVYVPAVLQAVGRAERQPPAEGTPAEAAPAPSPVPPKPTVSLGKAYFAHAVEKARQRAVRAGLRLAALLDAATP